MTQNKTVHLTMEQARKFILAKQGLLGEHCYAGKNGILDLIEKVGCIQFDPIDVCGRNADLVLFSRIKNYRKEWLEELLYRDCVLIDCWDKNMSIANAADWKYFSRNRETAWIWYRNQPGVSAIISETKNAFQERQCLSIKDFESANRISSSWGGTVSITNLALNALFLKGDIVVHHREGNKRYYTLANNALPQEIVNSADPNIDDGQYRRWHTARRIGAVGLMWNRASDVWIDIVGYNAQERNSAFEYLINNGNILSCQIAGIDDVFYFLAQDEPLINRVVQNERFASRVEFIAPLDCLMWDRKLIERIFCFSYKWEIYTPKHKRKFSHYTIPIIYGDKFVGRLAVKARREAKVLEVEDIWIEEQIIFSKRIANSIVQHLQKFKELNSCNVLEYSSNFQHKIGAVQK